MATAQSGSHRSLVGGVFARRWRVVSKLGEGGMGEVFAAEPVGGGPRIALKVLRPEFVADLPVLSRFLEEARTSVRLVHPNIVRVMEGAQAEDGSPYLVMELLEGVPLGAYTQNGGRVPLAQAVPIMQGILAGLAAAHALGVVHRDLKPDNVLLTRDAGGTFVVKLLDFGIAKVMDVAGGMGMRTRTGMLLGTPAYMSPEQAKNARDVDQRADLWSAGVLFYEMLTGRSAFPAPTEYARLAALISTEPEPVARIDPSLAPLGPFFDRALKKDRTERFSTAIEMAQALTSAAPGFGGRGSGPPAPLSRLPDVPSLFAPSVGAPPGTVPFPLGHGERGAAPVAEAPQAGEIIAVNPPKPGPSGAPTGRAPGGTLASPAAPAVVEAPANIAFVSPPKSPFGETLPSQDGHRGSKSTGARKAKGKGVDVKLVALFVMAGAVAGFVLGWVCGRM